MLNYLWAGMILVGVVFGAFNGKMQDITNAALDSSKEAVTLCITMIGVMAFWTGIMEIASKAGIIQMASRKMRPLIRFLFPGIPEGHKAGEHITTNFIANFLGLGWAATPAGLKAMEELGKLEDDRRLGKAPGIARKKGVASNEMCTFLIINIAPAHPHECDCLPEPVREPEPGGDRGRGDRGNGSQYGGCDCVLQADGSKAKGLRSPLFQ